MPAATTSSIGLRLTAYVAAALIFALAVFTASPELHSRLHAAPMSKAVGAGTSDSHVPDGSGPGHTDDDGCAVVLFGQGLLLAVIGVLLSLWRWRVITALKPFRELSAVTTPRYWLPPLCGPPVS